MMLYMQRGDRWMKFGAGSAGLAVHGPRIHIVGLLRPV